MESKGFNPDHTLALYSCLASDLSDDSLQSVGKELTVIVNILRKLKLGGCAEVHSHSVDSTWYWGKGSWRRVGDVIKARRAGGNTVITQILIVTALIEIN